MKSCVLAFLAFTASALAEFETWTSKDGKSVEMELLSVSGTGGSLSGKFRLKNGKSVSLDASKLADVDAKRLSDWKPGAGDPKSTFVESYLLGGDDPFESKGSDNGVNFEFLIEGGGVVAAKEGSLSVESFDLGTGKSARDFSWELNLFSHEANSNDQYQPLPAGLLLSIISSKKGSFSKADLDQASFKASVVMLTSTTTAEQSVNLKVNKNGKAEAKNAGPFKIKVENIDEDPFQQKGGKIACIVVEGPNAPACIISKELISDGKVIKSLEEARGSDVTVKIRHWTNIREVKVPCFKAPKTPGLLFKGE